MKFIAALGPVISSSTSQKIRLSILNRWKTSPFIGKTESYQGK